MRVKFRFVRVKFKSSRVKFRLVFKFKCADQVQLESSASQAQVTDSKSWLSRWQFKFKSVRVNEVH